MKRPRHTGRAIRLNFDRRDLLAALNRYFKAPFFFIVSTLRCSLDGARFVPFQCAHGLGGA